MSIGHRMQALRALLLRYYMTFAHCWKQRDAMRTGFFNHQEAEFLPAGLALQEQPGSPTLRWTGRILMAVVIFTLLWSVVGKVDIVVNASGKIIPSARTKTIGSVDVASVRSLHVAEGQAVKAGDVLIELDTSIQDAEHDKASGDAAAAMLLAARSQALIEAIDGLRPPRLSMLPNLSPSQWEAARRHLEAQYRDFRARLTQIDQSIAHHAAALPLVTRQAEDYKALAQQGDVAFHAWQDRERARIELTGHLAEARSQRAALIAQVRKDALDARTEGQRIAAASVQDARRAREHGRLLRLTAPVDGTVQQLAVHTVGGVVPAAQPLMQIVPREDHLEVEAFIENRDVGFVREGQDAAVKIEAFDYTRYGTVPAIVRQVSRDAIQDDRKGLIYAIKIALQGDSIMVDDRRMPLTAGMAANVEIRTGERRIIAYVLSPLVQHQREALRER